MEKITAYHGSPFTFDYFDIDYLGYATNGEGTSDGFFFAADKAHAEYWCERNSLKFQAQGEEISPCIMSVEISAGSIFEADVMDYRYLKDIIRAAEKASADCIVMKNVLDDESEKRRTMYFVFDPASIKILEREEYTL